MKKCLVIYDFVVLFLIFFIASWVYIFGYEKNVVYYASLLGLFFLAVVPWLAVLMSDLNKKL